eukprot:UN22644
MDDLLKMDDENVKFYEKGETDFESNQNYNNDFQTPQQNYHNYHNNNSNRNSEPYQNNSNRNSERTSFSSDFVNRNQPRASYSSTSSNSSSRNNQLSNNNNNQQPRFRPSNHQIKTQNNIRRSENHSNRSSFSSGSTSSTHSNSGNSNNSGSLRKQAVHNRNNFSRPPIPQHNQNNNNQYYQDEPYNQP